jgi:hypothetical protein
MSKLTVVCDVNVFWENEGDTVIATVEGERYDVSHLIDSFDEDSEVIFKLHEFLTEKGHTVSMDPRYWDIEEG